MYATVAELRAEGITASDERLESLIAEACSFIDCATGWFFEPRPMRIQMDGRGTRTIEPPVPPIRIDRITLSGSHVDRDNVTIVGAPVGPGFTAPSIRLLQGVFPRGICNISIGGTWGYTESDGTPMGTTPLAIRRAAILLALRLLGDHSAMLDVRRAWRIIEERTRDQSIRYSEMNPGSGHTGDPEIDAILIRYTKPLGLGAP